MRIAERRLFALEVPIRTTVSYLSPILAAPLFSALSLRYWSGAESDLPARGRYGASGDDRAGNDKVGTWAHKKPMSHNSFGHLFRITTWGESHGPAIGCVVDGCPPGIQLDIADIQTYLDKRKPGQSRYTTQRKEPDQVRILSGVFTDEASGEQVTTGTPIALEIENMDARSKDYGDIKDKFRPGHADYTYLVKYGVRDWRGSAGPARGRPRAAWRRARLPGKSCLACACAARWCRSGRMPSTGATGTGRRSSATRSSAPTPRR